MLINPVIDEIRRARGPHTIVHFEKSGLALGVDASPDGVAGKFGLKQIGKDWIEMPRERAELFLGEVLGRDLAYGVQIISDEKAKELANRFLAEFGDDAQFFANTAYRDGEMGSEWSPLTDSTFDAGIVAVSTNLVGILVVQDED